MGCVSGYSFARRPPGFFQLGRTESIHTHIRCHSAFISFSPGQLTISWGPKPALSHSPSSPTASVRVTTKKPEQRLPGLTSLSYNLHNATQIPACLHGGGRRRRRQRRGTGAGVHQENSSSHFWSPSSTGVMATAGMTTSPGQFPLSTQTATAPSDTASRPRDCGDGDSALVPHEELSERSPAGYFHNIALGSPSPQSPFPLFSPLPKGSGRAEGPGASQQSLSPSWGLRGLSPSSPASQQQQQASSPITRPPLRFLTKYVLGRGADTRGLFRLSEEFSSEVTSGTSSSGGESQGDDASSRLTASSSAGRTPSSAHSEGSSSKAHRGQKGVGHLWRGRKRQTQQQLGVRSSSTSSTSTAPGRRTILGFDSAFSSSPSAASSSSASVSSGKEGGRGSSILSPASV